MLKIIKKLDKENTSLKETNKTNQENYNTCKTFFKIFQKDIKDLHEKIQKLKFENKNLHPEIGKQNNVEVINKKFENSQVEFGKQIVEIVGGDSRIQGCTNIENFVETFRFDYYNNIM